MTLIVALVAVPGSGKTTALWDAGLMGHAVQMDRIRIMAGLPVEQPDHTFRTSQVNNSLVFSQYKDLIHARVRLGAPVICDSAHLSFPKDNLNYFDVWEHLFRKFGYKRWVVKIGWDLSIKDIRVRNETRPPLWRVPQTALDRMVRNRDTFKTPSPWEEHTMEETLSWFMAHGHYIGPI